RGSLRRGDHRFSRPEQLLARQALYDAILSPAPISPRARRGGCGPAHIAAVCAPILLAPPSDNGIRRAYGKTLSHSGPFLRLMGNGIFYKLAEPVTCTG